MNDLPRPAGRPLRILFVCTGNICRSPTAEAVARERFAAAGLAGCVEFDSAGTHGYHVGEAPDPRTQAAAARRGYDLSPLRARRLADEDFERFDLLLAMDRGHFAHMQHRGSSRHGGRVELFMRCAPDVGEDEVPDPYYGGGAGFEHVLDLCEAAVDGLLDRLRRES